MGTTLAESTMLARDLVNHPANVMTPTRMADTAGQVAAEVGLELDVMDRDRMAEHGMGSFLGVAQGSEEPPKLIVMTYRGDPGNPGNNLGLVGKGITFDTGGISLKPAANMEAMKGDMAGGASVIAAMRAIGMLKPKINVTGFIAATENMPRRSGAEAGRRGYGDERQDDRGDQHRCRGSARAGGRDVLRAQPGHHADGGRGDAHRGYGGHAGQSMHRHDGELVGVGEAGEQGRGRQRRAFLGTADAGGTTAS